MTIRPLMIVTTGIFMLGLAGSPAHAAPTVQTQTRTETATFARCLAERAGDEARALTALDIGTDAHERAARKLVRNSKGCLDETDLDNFDPLSLTGAFAEALMAGGQKYPAKRATNPADPMMVLSRCAVDADQDRAKALLSTPIGTKSEEQAAQALAPSLSDCAAQSDVVIALPDLRSMVAIILYQNLNARVAG